jgi:hypothetical protein
MRAVHFEDDHEKVDTACHFLDYKMAFLVSMLRNCTSCSNLYEQKSFLASRVPIMAEKLQRYNKIEELEEDNTNMLHEYTPKFHTCLSHEQI